MNFKQKKVSNKQSQHTVSQVYLKLFGYVEKSTKKYRISVIDKANFLAIEKVKQFWIPQPCIKSFLAEDNIFKLDCEGETDDCVFEAFSGSVENIFPHIVLRLNDDGFLHEKDESDLVKFMALILCKTPRFRSLISEKLKTEYRDYFIEEIFETYSGNCVEKLEMIECCKVSNYDLNFITLIAWEYVTKLMHRFNFYLLKCDRGFLTSDCPVMIEGLSIEKRLSDTITDIFFPICPRYAIHMFTNDENHNELNRKILDIEEDEKYLSELAEMTILHSYRFIIFPSEFNVKIPIVSNELDIENARIKYTPQ